MIYADGTASLNKQRKNGNKKGHKILLGKPCANGIFGQLLSKVLSFKQVQTILSIILT